MAKALYDISKLVIGIMVLGPLVSSQGFRVELLIGGSVAFIDQGS